MSLSARSGEPGELLTESDGRPTVLAESPSVPMKLQTFAYTNGYLSVVVGKMVIGWPSLSKNGERIEEGAVVVLDVTTRLVTDLFSICYSLGLFICPVLYGVHA